MVRWMIYIVSCSYKQTVQCLEISRSFVFAGILGIGVRKNQFPDLARWTDAILLRRLHV